MNNGDLKRFYANEPSSKTEEDFARKSDLTTIEANPEGDATEVLSKVQIGNTIYSVPAPNSDLSVATVTFIVDEGLTVAMPLAVCFDSESLTGILPVVGVTDSTGEVLIPLYKGKFYTGTDDNVSVTVTGDIEYDDGSLTISGDGTVTISSVSEG